MTTNKIRCKRSLLRQDNFFLGVILTTDFKPKLAVSSFEHLPEDVQVTFAFWARQGLSPAEIQHRLSKLKLTATKSRIAEWCKNIPGVEINSVDDLPPDLKALVVGAYLERKPTDEIKATCANLGYKVSDTVINRWFSELLRDRQQQELSGELDDNSLTLNEELLTRILTWCLDTLMKLLVNVDMASIKVETVQDLEKVVLLGLRSTQASMQYSKLKTDERHMLNRARQEMKNEVQRRLIGKPDVVNALFEVIDASASDMGVNVKNTG